MYNNWSSLRDIVTFCQLRGGADKDGFDAWLVCIWCITPLDLSVFPSSLCLSIILHGQGDCWRSTL